MEFIPEPYILGLPPQYTAWRKNQADAVWQSVNNEKPVTVSICPTGFGKSLMYVGASRLLGGKTVILTSTKGLQSQLMHDFAEMGMVDVRGKNAYKCVESGGQISCEQAACNSGYRCPYKRTYSCEYYAAVLKARAANLVVTNYSFWFYSNKFAEGIGRPNLLVCDEGHDAPQAVADFLTVRFDRRNADGMAMLPSHPEGLSLVEWKEWGRKWMRALQKELDRLQGMMDSYGGASESVFEEMAVLQKQYDQVHTVGTMDLSNWVVDITPMAVHFAPVEVKGDCHRLLFGGVKHSIVTSASVNYKTAEMLGLDGDDFATWEYPHTFPIENRMVIHVQGARLNAKASGEDLKEWLKTADKIIEKRQDRKGIFHTVSYERRDFVMSHSKYNHLMMSHNRTDTIPMIERFKNSGTPKVLVSPSVSTGFDFPYSECEFQIIGKVPYPDTRNKITAARSKADPEYGPYIAMQQLVQACGRGCRAEDDHCENFVIDDNIKWFIQKNRKFAPKWFTESVTSRLFPPDPPARIGNRPHTTESWEEEE